MVPERSAAFDLTWPGVPPAAPDAKDGGSAFVVVDGDRGAVGPAVAAAVSVSGGGGGVARGNLVRLPCGVWVFCGVDDAAGEVVLEAGWVISGASERLFATRRYDAGSGRLVHVALGCEKR